MTKWEQLVVARERKHLSQAEAAERINVGLVTYQRWELGKRKPQPQHMRHLCELFESLLEQHEEALAWEMPSPEKQPSSPSLLMASTAGILNREVCGTASSEQIDEPEAFIAAHMTTSLWSLAFKDHPTCNDKRSSIRQAIKEFDSMNINNKNYQITRREALCSLATLPIITFGLTIPGKEIASALYGSVLAQCAASLDACWELYKNGNAGEMLLGFRCASKYLATLRTISNTSAPHQKEAINLAAQYALLKTMLGWHCAGSAATVQYAQDAVTLSKETGDISLQLSACSKLAWAYFYEKKYSLALAPAQEAEAILQQYYRLSNAEPLRPCIQGGVYSTLALMQVKNGQLCDIALGKATERDPGNDVYAYLDFTRSSMLLEAGWVYYYQDNQAKAMGVLEKRVDPDTFSPRIRQSEMGRVETMNIMALSSLKTKDRDLEKTIHFWRAAVEGSKALRSEYFFNIALTTYEHMGVVWPGEPRIAELRDHIVHWDE